MNAGNSGNFKRKLAQRLESLERAGVRDLPRAKPVAPVAGPESKFVAGSAPQLLSAAPLATSTFENDMAKSKTADSASQKKAAFQAPLRSAAEREKALTALRAEVCQCTQCPALVANRTQTVFGVGNLSARLVFFGEAPGADEDREGEPFVGRAGQLLNKIIEAITLKREEVYILNVLKCRPPQNRPPEEDEVRNCRPFFERQLAILKPAFIVCLGASAAQALLETTESIGRLRGRLHAWRESQVVATYHPAYLLRNPAAKKDTWEDMQLLMRAMGIKVPASAPN